MLQDCKIDFQVKSGTVRVLGETAIGELGTLLLLASHFSDLDFKKSILAIKEIYKRANCIILLDWE